MRALVIYESMFGNTKLIAEAIANGLGRHMEAALVEVGEAPNQIPPDVDLVVVGGPTHAFGLSRPGTRRSAANEVEAPLVSSGIGLREWLENLGSQRRPVTSATFDTRINKPRLPGSAAAVAGRRLRRLGFQKAASPESFYVDGTIGPLLGGEYERAHEWGEALGTKTSAGRPVTI